MLGLWYAVAHGQAARGARDRRRRDRSSRSSRRRSSCPTTRRAAGRRSQGRYDAVGGSPGGIVKTALTHPLRAAPRRRRSIAISPTSRDLLAPLGGLPLLAPLVAATRAARARAEPPLGHADADVDPLPLHGRRDPGPRSPARCSGRRGCGGAAPRARRPSGAGVVVLDARRRRPARAAAGLAPRAVRLRPRDARSRRQRPRPRRRASAARRSRPALRSARRTRSARTCPSGAASSASRCCGRRAGSRST